MELLIVITGIVALFAFRKAIKAFSTGTSAQAEVLAESVIASAVARRTEQFEEFIKNQGDKPIYSHEEIMKRLKVQ